MTENNDFKYIIQDFGNIYIGARWTYGEMLVNDDMPFKWKAVITHYLLKDAKQDMTMESHIFHMTEKDFSFQTFKQLKAKFKMSVPVSGDDRRHKRSGYESREYSIEDIVKDRGLHEQMDVIIVEELHLTKLALMAFAV